MVFVPQLLTAIASALTMFSISLKIALVNLASVMPYILLLEYYVKRVEAARAEERVRYSESLYHTNKIVEEDNGASQHFVSSMPGGGARS